jgi:hypothetical protein
MTKAVAMQIVFDTCKGQGLTNFQAALIYSQGLQESGYDSHVFETDNNAFGMKMPKKRVSQYIAGKGLPAPVNESFPHDPYNFYARYTSLQNSVLDLLDRHRSFNINWSTITTVKAYIDFCISTHYFQGSPSIYESNVANFLAKFGDGILPA